MPEIGPSGLMSGDGKRSVATWLKQPRPSSTLPQQRTTVSRQHEITLLTLAEC